MARKSSATSVRAEQAMWQVIGALALTTVVSLLLLLLRILVTHSLRYAYLPWNLFLGVLPLVFAVWLRENLRVHPWNHWQNIGLSLLWLGFLPNSFYIISDLIHLTNTGPTAMLYDAAMLVSYILNGLVFGYASLSIVHWELLKRTSAKIAHSLVVIALLASSFAIYLGRYQRWNSWDVVLHPAGLLFDISSRVINPVLHGDTFIVTGVFFILLGSVYLVIYKVAVLIRRV